MSGSWDSSLDRPECVGLDLPLARAYRFSDRGVRRVRCCPRYNGTTAMVTNAERALDALGDATRRRVLKRLRNATRSVREIAEGMDVSRPAVSQHLKVLRAAGLVVV